MGKNVGFTKNQILFTQIPSKTNIADKDIPISQCLDIQYMRKANQTIKETFAFVTEQNVDFLCTLHIFWAFLNKNT